ncbi:MAG TPA: conjugal transfer protein TraR [Elusimicrobia bacterium]|jgi:DnaK suppressor protein|nr:conjugal transfer protein TraR [Elusimicrobiota bacterium]
MEKEKLEFFRRRLRDLEGELEADLKAAGGQSATVSLDESIGRLSRADALHSQQIGIALEANIKTRLSNVRAALTAIDAGTYGACRHCGKPIAEARLKAMPETPSCVNCSGRR